MVDRLDAQSRTHDCGIIFNQRFIGKLAKNGSGTHLLKLISQVIQQAGNSWQAVVPMQHHTSVFLTQPFKVQNLILTVFILEIGCPNS